VRGAIPAHGSPAPALPQTSAPAERTLGVHDRGVFADLDARVQLRLPRPLTAAQTHALLDLERQLLVLYSGDQPLKVYPVSERLPSPLLIGAQRLGLRPGDAAELKPLLAAERLAVLARGQEPPPGDTDGDGIPDPLDVLIGAHKTALNADRYDGRYVQIAFPLGDVPRNIGVCTDVIIRALRNAGIDLQRALQEDRARAPGSYPAITRPNPSIDHRRVKNLLPYFARHFEAHSARLDALDDPLQPGDIIFMDTFPDRPGTEHVGIVSNLPGPAGLPLIVNNWTDGTVTKPMALLPDIVVTQRYRVPPRRASVRKPIAAHITQLITVTAEGWNTWRARLQRYQRAAGGVFRAVGPAMPAVLGHGGYGWGDGLHGSGAPVGRGGPVKREGDGRSPAGVFALGTVHGYAPVAPRSLTLPYRHATAQERCVDDPSSAHYNQVVSTSVVRETWKSAELMLRADDMYELALDIEHNRSPIVPGHGSCIFAHAWAGPQVPVTGCTGLAKSDLRQLLTWLKPDSSAWVALPQGEYEQLRNDWNCPKTGLGSAISNPRIGVHNYDPRGPETTTSLIDASCEDFVHPGPQLGPVKRRRCCMQSGCAASTRIDGGRPSTSAGSNLSWRARDTTRVWRCLYRHHHRSAQLRRLRQELRTGCLCCRCVCLSQQLARLRRRLCGQQQ
jgi:uncharacterized protein YijF (DUF1287 family)/L,D-peptidoglycan transpeptidase YkuD (ErfK/YbiS/YcfS/YnhG family)